jgi:hypothetical protein
MPPPPFPRYRLVPNQYSVFPIKIPLTGDSYVYVDTICTFSEYFRRYERQERGKGDWAGGGDVG